MPLPWRASSCIDGILWAWWPLSTHVRTYVGNMRTCVGHMSDKRPTYVGDMSDICRTYVRHMFDIVRHMSHICPMYVPPAGPLRESEALGKGFQARRYLVHMSDIIGRTSVGHMSNICWNYVRRMSDTYHTYVGNTAYWTCMGHVWVICSRTFVLQKLDICWTCVGDIRTYAGHMLDACLSNVAHVSDMCESKVGHLLDMCAPYGGLISDMRGIILVMLDTGRARSGPLWVLCRTHVGHVCNVCLYHIADPCQICVDPRPTYVDSCGTCVRHI